MDQKNLDIYGSKPIAWSRALEQLEAAGAKTGAEAKNTSWLATVRPDGRPHMAGVGALWVDGRFYFTSGPGTRKSRNLAKNPNCVISVALPGLDLVVEGTARKVTDQPTLQRLAKLYAAQGWPASVSGSALTAEYCAPSAGPAPWDLYAVTPSTAFGVATAEPYGATRWRFEA
jgi:pyridoxamine 5'-phosphate oxidase-like protein